MTTSPGSKPSQPLLVVVGPTAAGKTTLSLELARKFDGEIVSADSRLLYRGLDIGTAKPSPSDLNAIPHHLIDLCRPDETLTLAQYQRLAYEAIDRIQMRDRLPILVGGTGQYVSAVVEGWGIPEVAPQMDLRRRLEQLGSAELVRWLQLLDPTAAERIDQRNTRRVIRALEVILVSGRPMSQLQQKSPPPYSTHIMGLSWDRDALYERIDRRVDEMIAAGLVQEVAGLLDAGYDPRLPALSALGYRQLIRYLQGECDLEEATERIKFETHRFARQQATWFHPADSRISWHEGADPNLLAGVAAEVSAWLTSH